MPCGQRETRNTFSGGTYSVFAYTRLPPPTPAPDRIITCGSSV
jgi:hypothetical protein